MPPERNYIEDIRYKFGPANLIDLARKLV